MNSPPSLARHAGGARRWTLTRSSSRGRVLVSGGRSTTVGEERLTAQYSEALGAFSVRSLGIDPAQVAPMTALAIGQGELTNAE